MQKTYNPFKMWGSWVGLGVGIFGVFMVLANIYSSTPFSFILSLNLIDFGILLAVALFPGWFEMYTMLFAFIGILTTPIVYFLYGWGIHSVLRKFEIKYATMILIGIAVFAACLYSLSFSLMKTQESRGITRTSQQDAVWSARVSASSQAELTSSDMQKITLAKNAIIEMAASEHNTTYLIDNMMRFASDDTLWIEVRLAALDELVPKVSFMSSEEKNYLVQKLLSLSDREIQSNHSSQADKGQIKEKITILRNLLAK